MNIVIASRLDDIAERIQDSIENLPEGEQYEALAKQLGAAIHHGAMNLYSLTEDWLRLEYNEWWGDSNLSKEDVVKLMTEGWKKAKEKKPKPTGPWWDQYLNSTVKRYLRKIDSTPEVDIEDGVAHLEFEETVTPKEVSLWSDLFGRYGIEVERGKKWLEVEVEQLPLPEIDDYVYVETPARWEKWDVDMDIEGTVVKVDPGGVVWISSEDVKSGKPVPFMVTEISTKPPEGWYDEEDEEEEEDAEETDDDVTEDEVTEDEEETLLKPLTEYDITANEVLEFLSTDQLATYV